jgi:hypothetical protein
MPIFASNFTTNSLSGSFVTADGFANVSLITVPYALEGNKSFVIKIRRGSTSGDVLATTNPITLTDNSTLVSVTANISTVNEGNLVSFSVVTANTIDNSNIYFSVFPVTSNVTVDDFVGNVGVFSITNNAGIFTLRANADLSLIDETGENFRVQIRTNSPTGNTVFTTSNIAIQDTSKSYNVIGLVAGSASPIVEGSNVTFTFTATNIPNGTILYYSTSGNVASFFANTGSFVMNGTSNTFVISNPQVPYSTTRAYSAVIRDGSAQGTIVATSNTIVVVDDALVTMSASGGSQSNISGYRVHTLLNSTNITFNKGGSIEYLIIGGGGSYMTWGGGGAGGLLQGTTTVTGTTYPVTVGIGGVGNGVNGGNTTALGFTAFGGGAGTNDGAGGGPGPAAPGGSGAGGGGNNGTNSGGDGVPGQGYPGGIGSPGPTPGTPGITRGGGGGGAGGPGSSGTYSGGNGAGGNGIWSSITGSNVAYAGGGNAGYTSAGNPWGSTGFGAGGGNGNPPQAGVVIIRYSTNAGAFVNITTPDNYVIEGSNIVFTLNTTDVSNNTLLYYYTVGNVITTDFVTSNIGSFRTTQNRTNIILQTNTNIATNEERFFQLRVTGDAGTSQDPLITSNVFYIREVSLVTLGGSGGTQSNITGYRVHLFAAPQSGSTMTFSRPGTIEYLMAGGGGGAMATGGGGAGGLLQGTTTVYAGNTYTITVGSGGIGPSQTKAGNTIAFGMTAYGGGTASNDGANGGPGAAESGGSGAGGGTNNGAHAGGNGVPGQGNPGGYSGPSFVGGGGGGAAGSGQGFIGPSPGAARGGNGIYSTITGSNVAYSGGGGGGFNNPAPTILNGVGGGSSSYGGGAAHGAPGQGGPGVVIIRYPA